MKTSRHALSALTVLLLCAETYGDGHSGTKMSKRGGKGSKGKSKGEGDGFGDVEVFLKDGYDFFAAESPESIVFDSRGNAYVSLTLTGMVSVIDPSGNEIHRIELPQGDCRPTDLSGITFPLSTLQFGMAMDKDDNLYVSLLACADGFPWPPNPNPNTGLWKVDTETYEIELLHNIPNADGSGREQFCCDWNTMHWPEETWDPTDPFVFFERDADGNCIPETCCLYEAVQGSRLFPIEQFCGYAQIWNGVEVIGDYIYVTNSYFHEIWRMMKDGSGDPEVWLEYGASDDLIRLRGTFFTAAGFNGIEYHDGNIYVANTAQGKIVKIPLEIAEDDSSASSKSKSNKMSKGKGKGKSKKMSGKKVTKHIKKTGGGDLVPGEPELVYSGGDSDEFVLDKKGNIYAAQFEDNRVIKVHTDGTEEVIVQGGETVNAGACNFDQAINDAYSEEVDLPTSVSFGTTKETGKETLYIANSGFIFFKSCAGQGPFYDSFPGITRVDVREKGDKQIF